MLTINLDTDTSRTRLVIAVAWQQVELFGSIMPPDCAIYGAAFVVQALGEEQAWLNFFGVSSASALASGDPQLPSSPAAPDATSKPTSKA